MSNPESDPKLDAHSAPTEPNPGPRKLSEGEANDALLRATHDAYDPSGLTPDELKREFDIFRDVLSNVNNTLRFQIQLGVPLLAGCVTVLNIVPPQQHQELLNELDRWVFIPAIASMVIGYRALEFHYYAKAVKKRFGATDIMELYQLVRYKHRMVRYTVLCQGLGLILLMVFVLLEYK